MCRMFTLRLLSASWIYVYCQTPKYIDNSHFMVQNIPYKVHNWLAMRKRMFITAFIIGGIYSIHTFIFCNTNSFNYFLHPHNDSCPMPCGAHC
jgi:hypothetical protein